MNNDENYEGGQALIQITRPNAAATETAVESFKDEIYECAKEEEEDECQFKVCGKAMECGHSCRGVRDESDCLPCLNIECIESAKATGKALVSQNAAETELCCICYTSELGEEACVRLACGHVYHANCIALMLEHGHSTLRITFGYLDCPSCKAEIQIPSPAYVPLLSEMIERHLNYKRKITTLAIETAREEGCEKNSRVAIPGDAYYGKLEEFAMHFCTFYTCSACHEPYFGGM